MQYSSSVLLNNHKAVWGSWYDRESAQWGFACCHSISKSYGLFASMRTHVQSPDPIVSDKQVSPPHQPFLPTPYSSHAKNMTGSKKPQKLSEQQLKLKSSSLEREKRLLDGRNRRKERRLNSTKQDSRRPLMKRKRERTSPMMSSWRGQRSRKRMSRRKRWVRFHI